MHCENIDVPGVGRVIICGRNPSIDVRAACRVCGAPASKLCDFPTRRPVIHGGRQTLQKGTCDAPLCEKCTTDIGGDSDLCPVHAKAWKGKAVGA